MKERLNRETIAMRIAKEIPNNSYVNLGIGIPTLVSQFTSPEQNIIFHSENGVLNYGSLADSGKEDPDLINAGGQFLKPTIGMSFFNSADAFAMIRGGHIDISVLGALQISAKGDLANWMIPERGIGNIGGAMDLATGAKKLIVAMEHTDRNNNPKIVSKCSYPLTVPECVNLIVTDLCVILVESKQLTVKEIAPGWNKDEIQNLTEAKLLFDNNITEITL
ncbi:MAG: 3-oxoacid CoA-transferase subunit B [SAR202 cluster bacterium]|nr:succinyl-CoA--3-ketoacid-CoA transferase [Chloroflexota bacterium]MQG50635.1 3-oxoacid CoA-transferase subunit B [SAR202 cluster bacterium]